MMPGEKSLRHPYNFLAAQPCHRARKPIQLVVSRALCFMLAPFAPHVHKDEGLKASYSNLAARCLLAGKSDAIQVPAKPVNAFIRSDDDDGLIQDGSHVILYSTRDNIETLIIKRNATFDNKHGHFLHNDFIGKPYGSRVRPRLALN